MGAKPRRKPVKRPREVSMLRLFELYAVIDLHKEGDRLFFDMMKERK